MSTAPKLRKFIPVDEAIARWEKDPNFRRADAALEDEFALVTLILRAGAAAGLTQEQLATRMESGTSQPSTRTLQKLAAATGHRLKISFEPEVA